MIRVHIVPTWVTRVGLPATHNQLQISFNPTDDTCTGIRLGLTTRMNEVFSSTSLSIMSRSHSHPLSGRQSYVLISQFSMFPRRVSYAGNPGEGIRTLCPGDVIVEKHMSRACEAPWHCPTKSTGFDQ